ncbi:hypothetical protein KZX46_20875 [Polymorphobacter sp. PAMC 29334]|uniref:hypothetical protein n=1 Tax=Polymorphobacter sp. PAMC 29334 TaxID=2862331 RepID=UPI001C73FCC2|nr:hypothetical protein [Polymorphobacter sp. PAMC 29334]QYE35133.1 hypothetical protein KZX46_20875 [Polymorphobacter sp. PAMC 29334]
MKGLPLLVGASDWIVDHIGFDREVLAHELGIEFPDLSEVFLDQFTGLLVGDDRNYFPYQADRYGNLSRHD